ncbi:MAG: desulfoferrodoxin [Patescibacteria group bacterium]|nr:desulfoferrodoxin [Patescibacteria group bacterium]
MVQLKQIYRCSICGNVVEVLHASVGQLVCCGKPMELLIEKTKDIGAEKHVPIIEKKEGGIKVRVGSIPHPMEEKHYLEWIELVVDGKSFRQFLHPDQKAEAEFLVKVEEGSKIFAREYCNLHGLWKGFES